jgi:xanthine/uracil/vitamin C permease (AzgA family)
VRNFLFRLIGILEVAGGFFGMVNMLRRLIPFGTHDSIVAVIGLLLYAFVLIAGVLLLEGSERGVALSGWAQLMQLPLIATPIFSYALHCGAYVNVFATLQMAPRLALDWHFGSEGFLLAVAGPGVSRLGINLLALLSWLALRLR